MTSKKKSQAPKEPQYVTAADLDAKLSSMSDRILNSVADALESIKSAKADKLETVETKAVATASPNKYSVNEEWEQVARDMIGEAVHHTEVEHTRTGGVRFTVVIKKDFSNAGQDYLDMTGQDRRTRDVAQEGYEGVVNWCRLIKQNLGKPR